MIWLDNEKTSESAEMVARRVITLRNTPGNAAIREDIFMVILMQRQKKNSFSKRTKFSNLH